MTPLSDTAGKIRELASREARKTEAVLSSAEDTGTKPTGPTYRDFILSAMRTRKDAIDRFASGDLEGGSSRVAWLNDLLSDPEVSRKLSGVAVAKIPGMSEYAEALTSGSWMTEVTAARFSGEKRGEAYLKATHGTRVGGLMFKVSQNTATESEISELHRRQSQNVKSAIPIRSRANPATGQPGTVIGSAPDTEHTDAVIDGTTSVLGAFGLPRYTGTGGESEGNPDWDTYATTTDETVDQLYRVYGDKFHAGRAKIVGMVNKWLPATGKSSSADKIFAFNSLAPTFEGIAAEAEKSGLRADVVEFLDNLPPEITQDQFRRDVPGALAKFLEYKKYDKLVRDNEQSFGSLDEGPSLSSMYRDASGVSSLVKHSFGDDDPTKTSVVERRIELGKRLEKRDLENQRAAAGISRVLGPDGKPQAATPPEQIVARVYGAATKAIATAQATGNNELVGAIIDSSLGKIRDEFRRAGGGEAVDNMTDADLTTIARRWLDLDAVQGSAQKVENAKKAMPTPKEAMEELDKLQKTPGISQAEANRLNYRKGKLAAAVEADSLGEIKYSDKESDEYKAYMDLPDSDRAKVDKHIERLKLRTLTSVTRGLFTKEFVKDGVLNIPPQTSGIFAKEGSGRAAKKVIFVDAGLGYAIHNTRDQDLIVAALQGATPDQATVILKDIIESVGQIGRVDTSTLNILDPVDPGHRARFEPPRSLTIALMAGAGVPAARDAMNRLPDAEAEATQGTEAGRTYQEVLARLSPEGKKWFKQAVPGGVATVDDQLRDLLNAAFATGDTKGFRETLRLSGELKSQASKRQQEWFDTVSDLLARATKAAEDGNAAVYEATQKALAGLKFPLGPMPESTPTTSAKPAAAVDN